nr:hypothetical protein [Nostoc sp. DedQUE02]
MVQDFHALRRTAKDEKLLNNTIKKLSTTRKLAYCLLPIAYCLLPIPYSLFPIPYSLTKANQFKTQSEFLYASALINS